MTPHNASAKIKYQIRQRSAQRDAVVNQPASPNWPARLGDINGVLYVDPLTHNNLLPGYVNIHDTNGIPSIAYNQRVPNRPGLPVLVGYDPLQPRLFQVLSQRDTYATQPAISLPYHHQLHEWQGEDTVWVKGEQFLPQLVIPSGGMIVVVYPQVVFVGTGFVNMKGQQKNFTSSIPSTGAQMALLCVDSTGTLVITMGGTQTSQGLLSPADIPAVPSNQKPLCAVKLHAGQTQIMNSPTYSELIDLRFSGWGSGGGSSVSGTPYLIFLANSSGHIGTFNPYLWAMSGFSANEKSPSFGFDRANLGGHGLVHSMGDGAGHAGRFYSWSYDVGTTPAGQTGIASDGPKGFEAYVHAGRILNVVRGGGFSVIDGLGTVDVQLAQVEIREVADADWSTDSSWPTRIEIWITKPGSTTLSLVATYHSDGTFDGESIPPSMRVMRNNVTLLDGQCWVVSGYVDDGAGSYVLDMQGDSVLDIL